jgi:hypothetical protein
MQIIMISIYIEYNIFCDFLLYKIILNISIYKYINLFAPGINNSLKKTQ